MIRCSTCGGTNADGVTYCAVCGAHFFTASQAAQYTPPRGNPVTITMPSPRRYSASKPFVIYDDARQLTVPLRRSFRFIHEPVTGKAAAPFVGRRNEIESLAERILFSEGGSFLVTGYRGVGKTSFVNQVIRKLEDALPWAKPLLGETEVVDVYLNIARPVQPSEMMHHIIRRMHDRMAERGIYGQLDEDLREALKLAYDRTSVNMARKLAESSERSFGVNEASIGGEWMKAAMKVSWNSKRSRTNNYEVSFLGYDDKAAEHDVISLSQRLACGYVRKTTRLERWWNSMRRVAPGRVRLKIVFVFDELDKLEEFTTKAVDDSAPPKPAIDDIIGSLKNLFTTSGLTFIFVAGKDLHERWLDDVGRGDSVYESVFAYDKYLPCLWADVGTICDAFVDRGPGLEQYPGQVFDAFKKYLAYRGRGIPRRIIRTFNEYVEWDGDQPSLRFDWKDIRRIRFFAGLQGLVDSHQATLFGESIEEVSGTQSDKRRLGVYYLIDWILRRGPAEFTLKDVLDASRRLSVKIALAEEIAPRVAEDIISVLLDADYIQQTQQNFTHVVIGAPTAEPQKRYRVAQRRLVEMGGEAESSEIDALLGFPPDDTLGKRERLPQSIAGFRVVREIGRGGMGVVYEGMDERHGQRVAIKVLNEALTSQGDLSARFEREAMILKALDHPNIVRLVDWGHQAAKLYIAMEYLDGVTLEEVIRRRGRLPLQTVIGIAEPVASAVQYVHQKGFVRNDIKPNNIMLTSYGRVCLLDFGISRPSKAANPAGDLDTQSFVIIGTPQFMAPEQFGRTGVDERSDIYSLGIVLYRMLTGVYPFEGTDLPDLMRAHFERVPAPPSTHAPIPGVVDAIVMRCLEKDPNARYQTMAELATALRGVGKADSAIDLGVLVNVVRAVAKEIDELDGMRTMANRPITIGVDGVRRSSGARVSANPMLTPPSPRPTPAPSAAAPPASPLPQFGSSKGHTPRMAADVLPDVPDVAPPFVKLYAGNTANVVNNLGEPSPAVHLTKKTTVGRNSENDLVLRDASVSRFHAVFDTDGREWFVEDANSGLGTYVNGNPVIDRWALRDGDVIELGEFAFAFGAEHAARPSDVPSFTTVHHD